jgi:hypothetical protein
MINILKMNFPDDTDIDVGSIAFDREGDLILLGADMYKLNTLLTRAVCIGIYNVDTFYFQTGDIAYTIDTSRLFMYESTNDTWIEQEI